MQPAMQNEYGTTYTLHLINHGYDIGVYQSIDEAMDKAKQINFEISITIKNPNEKETGIFTYSPINGFSMIKWSFN